MKGLTMCEMKVLGSIESEVSIVHIFHIYQSMPNLFQISYEIARSLLLFRDVISTPFKKHSN